MRCIIGASLLTPSPDAAICDVHPEKCTATYCVAHELLHSHATGAIKNVPIMTPNRWLFLGMLLLCASLGLLVAVLLGTRIWP